jgi:uncharacterized membrane protein YhaH (DUF805 family)
MSKFLHNLFSLKGAINIKEFWVYSIIAFFLFLFIALGIFISLTIYLNHSLVDTTEIILYYKYFIKIFLLLSLFLNWVFLALAVKRSHDLNEKGYLVYFAFAISILLLIGTYIQVYYIYGYQFAISNISLPQGIANFINYSIIILSILESILILYLCIHLGFKRELKKK